MMLRPIRLSALCSIIALLSLVGCLQIETRVQIHEDASITVTERMQFSRRLIDLAAQSEDAAGVLAMLERKAVEARVEHMGEGAELVSHEIRDGEQGSKESVAVFTLPHINNFRYVSPYLARENYPNHTMLQCELFPVYEGRSGHRRAGVIGVRFTPVSSERRRGDDDTPAPTPQELQIYRDLQPVFQDMMQGLRLRLVFESYAPIRFGSIYYRYRGRGGDTKEYDLIDFSCEDLDRHGYEFLANEEIMIELLRRQFGGSNLTATTGQHGDNLTVPVFHPTGIPPVYFPPSRHLFDEHFEGRTLQFIQRRGGPRDADFDEIGYQPRTADSDDGDD